MQLHHTHTHAYKFPLVFNLFVRLYFPLNESKNVSGHRHLFIVFIFISDAAFFYSNELIFIPVSNYFSFYFLWINFFFLFCDWKENNFVVCLLQKKNFRLTWAQCGNKSHYVYPVLPRALQKTERERKKYNYHFKQNGKM